MVNVMGIAQTTAPFFDSIKEYEEWAEREGAVLVVTPSAEVDVAVELGREEAVRRGLEKVVILAEDFF